jgi:hypothetical protein
MLRRQSLDEALTELEQGLLAGAVRIVVSRDWWAGLSHQAQTDYQSRCQTLHVTLLADERMSPHFVEVSQATGDDPPLSSEFPI